MSNLPVISPSLDDLLEPCRWHYRDNHPLDRFLMRVTPVAFLARQAFRGMPAVATALTQCLDVIDTVDDLPFRAKAMRVHASTVWLCNLRKTRHLGRPRAAPGQPHQL